MEARKDISETPIPESRVHIRLSSGGYPITWSLDAREIFSQIKKELVGRRSFLLTDQTVHKLYEGELTKQFHSREILPIPSGEEQKSLATIEALVEKLIRLGADRKSTLIAFGGGVVGDVTGFLASVYMRGIPYLQVPTTLLSMVDSSVGGKTGVNSGLGKNMIGTFYQPQSVWICMEFLKTLPEREFRSGLAEAVKSSLIKDQGLYPFIRENAAAIKKKDLPTLCKLSYESVLVKRWVVQKDEKEANLRALLNLGHTLAHSLEKHFNYRRIYHGEAVSVGIAFAAFYSFKKGFLRESEWKEIQELLDRLDLPGRLEHLIQLGGFSAKEIPDPAELVCLMKSDKKNQKGNIRFVFCEGIGKCLLPQEVEADEVREMLESFFLLK